MPDTIMHMFDEHAAAQRKHARRRSRERLGIKLKRKQYARLVKDIQNGRAIFVDRQPNGVEYWRVVLTNNDQERQAIAVYDPVKKQIVTFLKISMTNVLRGTPFGFMPGLS